MVSGVVAGTGRAPFVGRDGRHWASGTAAGTGREHFVGRLEELFSVLLYAYRVPLLCASGVANPKRKSHTAHI